MADGVQLDHQVLLQEVINTLRSNNGELFNELTNAINTFLEEYNKANEEMVPINEKIKELEKTLSTLDDGEKNTSSTWGKLRNLQRQQKEGKQFISKGIKYSEELAYSHLHFQGLVQKALMRQDIFAFVSTFEGEELASDIQYLTLSDIIALNDKYNIITSNKIFSGKTFKNKEEFQSFKQDLDALHQKENNTLTRWLKQQEELMKKKMVRLSALQAVYRDALTRFSIGKSKIDGAANQKTGEKISIGVYPLLWQKTGLGGEDNTFGQKWAGVALSNSGDIKEAYTNFKVSITNEAQNDQHANEWHTFESNSSEVNMYRFAKDGAHGISSVSSLTGLFQGDVTSVLNAIEDNKKLLNEMSIAVKGADAKLPGVKQAANLAMKLQNKPLEEMANILVESNNTAFGKYRNLNLQLVVKNFMSKTGNKLTPAVKRMIQKQIQSVIK